MFILVGGMLAFPTGIIKDNVSSFKQDTKEFEDISDVKIDFTRDEVVFWIFILFTLGAATFILIDLLEKMKVLMLSIISQMEYSGGFSIFHTYVR